MNLGYGKFNDRNANAVCPLCKSNVYIFKNELNYRCVNLECFLSDGANECIERINKIIYNILDDNSENNSKGEVKMDMYIDVYMGDDCRYKVVIYRNGTKETVYANDFMMLGNYLKYIITNENVRCYIGDCGMEKIVGDWFDRNDVPYEILDRRKNKLES